MKIKVYLNDWFYNAGIVGFLRILEANDDEFAIKRNNYIEFDTESLRKFHKYYFKYFFQKYNEKDIITFEEWKSIGDYYYPLYWGKDSNLGFRLFSHIHTRDSLGTLQLDSRQYLNQYFDKGKIIYGAVLCNKISCCETELRNTFPDIFITHVGKYDFPN